jgi:hypothetical protein
MKKPVRVIVDKFVDGAKKYDEMYRQEMIRAVEAYEDPRRARSTIRQHLSRAGCAAFAAHNPYSKQEWLRYVLEAFLKDYRRSVRAGFGFGSSAPLLPIAMLTITDKLWTCPHNNIQFDLDKAKQKIWNALRGIDFIGAFEVAVYVNEETTLNGVTGKLLSFHVHLLVWASSRSTLDRHCKTVQSRFVGMLGRKHGIRIDKRETVKDACRTLRYAAKLPLWGKRTFWASHGVRQKQARISQQASFNLLNKMRNYKVHDFWLGSGRGAKILKKARARALREWKEFQKADRGPLKIGRPSNLLFASRRSRGSQRSRVGARYRQGSKVFGLGLDL